MSKILIDKATVKLALEALETERDNYQDWDKEDGAPEYIYEAITALREALAEQPAQQEPVAWTLLLVGEHHGIIGKAGDAFASAPEHYRRVDVYTTPPQRTWVGLTLDERIELAKDVDWPVGAYCEYAEKIEAKLKEKNT